MISITLVVTVALVVALVVPVVGAGIGIRWLAVALLPRSTIATRSGIPLVVGVRPVISIALLSVREGCEGLVVAVVVASSEIAGP